MSDETTQPPIRTCPVCGGNHSVRIFIVHSADLIMSGGLFMRRCACGTTTGGFGSRDGADNAWNARENLAYADVSIR